MKTTLSLVGALFLALLAGCAREPTYQGQARVAGSPKSHELGEAPSFKMAVGGGGDGRPNAEVPDQDAQPARNLPTKIIRTGDVQLIVDNFDTAFAKFKQYVDAIQGAYIAKAEISGSVGSPRHGAWKVRVPTASFDAFMDELAGLGVPQRNLIDSRDVTEEYYDLDARLRNKKAEEARLVKHLEASTGKLDEILKVEHEISRVRGEIEQTEGRLKMIDNLASLTTINVTMQEIKDYVPPQEPTFGVKIQRTFGNSTDALTEFGKFVVLFLVGLAPWAPLIAGVGLCIYLGVRSYRRKHMAASPVTGQPELPPAG